MWLGFITCVIVADKIDIRDIMTGWETQKIHCGPLSGCFTALLTRFISEPNSMNEPSLAMNVFPLT